MRIDVRRWCAATGVGRVRRAHGIVVGGQERVERALKAFGAEDLNGLWQTLQVKYNEYTPAEIARFWRTKTARRRPEEGRLIHTAALIRFYAHT